MKVQDINKSLQAVFVLAAFISGMTILANYLAVAPVGTSLPLGLNDFVFLAAAVACAAIPIGLLGLCFSRARVASRQMLLNVLIFSIVVIAGLRLGAQIRKQGLIDLARRSRPLVASLHRYEVDHGRPAESLDQLVPKYLPAVPGTGIAAYPEYKYTAAPKRNSKSPAAWELVVSTPNGMMNWDCFVYLSDRNYPDAGYGGVLEPIEEWAYVHE